MLHHFNDIHTHIPSISGSILSVPAEGVEPIVSGNTSLPAEAQQHFSIQLHPWHLVDSSIATFVDVVNRYHEDPHFVAVGECGLDGLCAVPISQQRLAYREALRVARQFDKPVIIHCVKLWADIITETRPFILDRSEHQEFIIHGFRKGPQLAQQLLNAGFSISIGQHFNRKAVEVIPPDRLYHETDEGG